MDSQVVVVGAGAAGLASAGELSRRGVRPVVLDQADAIGASWRSRYDRLRLNSSRWFSTLPHTAWARGTGTFPARDEVVGYLEAYATAHRLDVRFGTRLERIDRNDHGWLLRTTGGDYHAGQVIVAAGYDHTGHIPDWPGRERFAGTLIHSAAYRNALPYEDADVLVVGPGCSGMEIAYDLVTGGAGRVRLAVRTPPNMMIRSPAGPLIANTLRRFPPAWADRVADFARRHEIGDLTEYGLPLPDEGVFSRLRRLKVAPAIVDKEVVEAIVDRRIEIVAGVASLDETGVFLADGSRIEPHAVIAATGYRCGLDGVAGHLGVLDERGAPLAAPAEEAAPGLRFVGYHPLPAHLGHIGREGKRAAAAVARTA